MDNKNINHYNMNADDFTISTDVFYANAMMMNFNESELVLNFEQKFPNTQPEARTIVLSIESLRAIHDNSKRLIELYEEMIKNDEYTK